MLTTLVMLATLAASPPDKEQSKAGLCRPGAAVDILWQGTWWAGRVTGAPVQDGACPITYDGYLSSWDEAVGPERLRAATGTVNPAPSDAPAQTAAPAGPALTADGVDAELAQILANPARTNSDGLRAEELARLSYANAVAFLQVYALGPTDYDLVSLVCTQADAETCTNLSAAQMAVAAQAVASQDAYAGAQGYPAAPGYDSYNSYGYSASGAASAYTPSYTAPTYQSETTIRENMAMDACFNNVNAC